MFYFEFSTVIYLFLWDQTFWCSRCRFELGGCFTVGVKGWETGVCVCLISSRRICSNMPVCWYLSEKWNSFSDSNKVITRDFKWLIKALLLMALEYSRNKFLFMTQKDSIVTNCNLQQWHKCKVINDFFFWWFQDVQFKKVNKNCETLYGNIEFLLLFVIFILYIWNKN